MVAPLLCGTLFSLVPASLVAVITSFWVHQTFFADKQHLEELVEPLSWKRHVPFLLFLLILLSDLAQLWLYKLQVQPLKQQQTQLRQEAAELRSQAAKLSSPATFAQSAKLQRKAIAKEKELALFQNRQNGVLHSWLYAAPGLLKTLSIAAFVVWMWGQPALFLDPRWLWPFGRWFTLPQHSKLRGLGAITAVPWVAICHRTSAALIRRAPA